MTDQHFTAEQKFQHDLRHFPVRPHVGVGGVISWEDKVVIIKRKYNPSAGKWAIPGGHLKLGEPTAEGALRECIEETGLNLRITGFAGVIDRIDFVEDGKCEYHYVLVDYLMEVVGNYSKEHPPVPVAQSDVLDAIFVSKSTLINYDLTHTTLELFRNIGIVQ